MSPQVTLKDIASKLNVSKVTVSKALRDHPDISQETKRIVREMAALLGYTPNFVARNLSSRKSNTIGLVVPKIAHHFFATAVETIYSIAFNRGYEIMMAVSQENAEFEIKHIQTLLSMRVDGLLISVTEQTRDNEIFNLVKKKKVPLVFFDRVIKNIGFSSVTTDDREGAARCTNHAIDAGYTKIAHLAGYNYTNIGRERLAGFEAAMKARGLEINNQWVIEGGFSEEDGYRGFLKLFKNPPMPEVIFAVTFPVAMGIYTAAKEIGMSIPHDIDIISFGGSDYNRFFSPSMTFLDQPAAELSEMAMSLLIDEIKNPDMREARELMIPGELIICQTCHKE
ncbi:MAG: LacI family transcriptional regulator [Calditrichales bacterium]|nr:MAG: LacI family transcriptional regulator [Calditrichales bacterium]